MDYITFLKKYSGVSSQFIDDFFSLYTDKNKRTDKVIPLDKIVKYLECRKDHIIETLKTTYKRGKDYDTFGTYDSPGRGRKRVRILLTPKCFVKVCMMTRTAKGEEVREYFVKAEETLRRYSDEINQAMMARIVALESNQRPLIPVNVGGAIYVIRVKKGTDLYKLGRSDKLRRRLSNYMSGLADNSDLEIVFVYKTDRLNEMEECLKGILKTKQYRNKKEVFEIDLEILRMLITEHCPDALDTLESTNVKSDLKHLVDKGKLVIEDEKGHRTVIDRNDGAAYLAIAFENDK